MNSTLRVLGNCWSFWDLFLTKVHLSPLLRWYSFEDSPQLPGFWESSQSVWWNVHYPSLCELGTVLPDPFWSHLLTHSPFPELKSNLCRQFLWTSLLWGALSALWALAALVTPYSELRGPPPSTCTWAPLCALWPANAAGRDPQSTILPACHQMADTVVSYVWPVLGWARWEISSASTTPLLLEGESLPLWVSEWPFMCDKCGAQGPVTAQPLGLPCLPESPSF